MSYYNRACPVQPSSKTLHIIKWRFLNAVMIRISAIADGLHNAHVSRNLATTKHSIRKKIAIKKWRSIYTQGHHNCCY